VSEQPGETGLADATGDDLSSQRELLKELGKLTRGFRKPALAIDQKPIEREAVVLGPAGVFLCTGVYF
jgi:hypothetical protein